MSEVMIVSSLPGRLRLRGGALRGSGRNQTIQTELRGCADIVAVEGNPASGSILLRYDATRVSCEEMGARVLARFQASAGAVAPSPSPSPSPSPETHPGFSLWRLNRPAKIGMLVSLTASLLALTRGAKLHAAFGVMHLSFLTIHLLNHKKKLVK